MGRENLMMHFRIVRLSRERERERESCFGPFQVTERAKLRYIAGKWSWKPMPVSSPWLKHYPVEAASDGMEHVVFLCEDRGEPAGQVTLCMWWNHFAFVDRVDVAPAYRRKGVATMLLQRAKEWAREQNARGLFTQTQDINAPAMLLYEKCGFSLCGIDTMLYYNSPHRGETAVFYYLLFPNDY